MKNIIVLLLFLSLGNTIAQTKKKETTAKKENLEYFDIEKYKDWEIDNSYTSKEDDKFLKKGNDRIRIYFDDEIQVEKTSVLYPYREVFVYYGTRKTLYSYGVDFYRFSIGIDKVYDENGKVIKKINNDKPYKFSVQKLIQKFKKEYHVDLEDFTLGNWVLRRKHQNIKLKGRFFYEVRLVCEENGYKIRYYLIDGTTGKLLHKTFYYRRELRDPFDEYLRKLDNQEIPDEYLFTFEGKKYTRNEWDAHEKEVYKQKQGNKKR